MKFEKFLKAVGTHGEIVTVGEYDKWLVCDGVGMLIPRGVDNLLGEAKDSEYASIVHALAYVEMDEPLTLSKAVLLDPTGNAAAIYRVFTSDLGSVIGITNTDYGFLEKSDRLGYQDIEVPTADLEATTTVKFMVVYNPSGQAIGYITGSAEF